MARVAVLIDRAPRDPDWKGGAAWTLINALAESQHDVQVFTPLDPAAIESAHPRVQIARPAPSFGIATMVTWGRALAQYQPEIVHTFAPRPARFAGLTIWPYLEGLGPVLRHTRRIATVFEAADTDPGHAAARWLRGHARWTAFARDLTLATGYAGELDQLSLIDALPWSAPGSRADKDVFLIPAPVAEWIDADHGWRALRDLLRDHPARRARIVGGWGEVSLAARRDAWAALGEVADRVEMTEPWSLSEFLAAVGAGAEVWAELLAPTSWRARVAAVVQLGVEREARFAGGRSEETLNQLSRIYSSPGRW